MKLRSILVDDEVHALQAMELLLGKYCPQVLVTGKFRSGAEALVKIPELEPDLIFLDIEMPGMSGFEMLESLEGEKPEVIFVTAYDQYAINAIRVSAMGYLLKPVDAEDLINAVKEAESRIANQTSSMQMDVLLSNIKTIDGGFHKLAIPDPDGLRFINISDIVYCSADGNYTHVTTAGGQTYMLSKTLKDIHEMIDHPAFFRTHQSFLVNLNYIDKYVRGSGGHLVLQGGVMVQVARARKEALMKVIYK